MTFLGMNVVTRRNLPPIKVDSIDLLAVLFANVLANVFAGLFARPVQQYNHDQLLKYRFSI